MRGLRVSAFGGKAGHAANITECLLLTQSGHRVAYRTSRCVLGFDPVLRGPGPGRPMRRREFITIVGGAVMWPLAAHPQQAGVPVIGFMSSRSLEGSTHLLAAFRQGLGETGFTEGQNVAIEFRWAQGQYQRLPEFAADLVNRRVAVFTAVGGETSALAAKQATSTIPIVFSSADPVKSGLVESTTGPAGMRQAMP